MSQYACHESADGAFDLPYTEVTSMNLLNNSRGQPSWDDHPSRWLGGQPATHHGKKANLLQRITQATFPHPTRHALGLNQPPIPGCWVIPWDKTAGTCH